MDKEFVKTQLHRMPKLSKESQTALKKLEDFEGKCSNQSLVITTENAMLNKTILNKAKSLIVLGIKNVEMIRSVDKGEIWEWIYQISEQFDVAPRLIWPKLGTHLEI